MDPLLANSYFVQFSPFGAAAYSNPLYNTALITSPPSVSTIPDYCPGIDIIKDEAFEYDSHSTNSSPSELPRVVEPIKTDLRKIRRKGKGTNLYGRPYCPGRPLSMEARTRIIELHMNGMKVNAISKTICVSHGCVSKIISRYRQTGVLTPASSPDQRRSRRLRKRNCTPDMAAAPQENYVPLEYAVQNLNFVGHPEMPSPTGGHFAGAVIQPSYAVLHDQMVQMDYHPSHLML